MAERIAYLEAVVGADITQFRKSMREIRNESGILSETISGIGGAARTATFAFTAPVVALGTYALDAAAKFDGAMRNINSILGLTETNFQSLSSEVFDYAKTTRAGVVPATEALYEIFSAGITDQEKAMAVWKTSNSVAEAGLADLEKTTNAITATMNAFNLSTDQSTRVGNVWTRMVQLGVGSLDDFLTNAQKILPLSNLLGVSLEDMGASVAFISQGGGGAAKAETAFAMAMSNLLKPTTAMNEAFGKLGVTTGKELVKKFGSVADAIMALRGVSDDIDFNKMFSKTGLEAAGMITANFDKFKDSVTEFNDGLDTATMDAWTQQSKSFSFQLDLMKTALQGVETVIGNAIIPLVTPLVTGFRDLLTSVSEANPQLVQLGVIFVGIVAAAAPVIWLLTSLVSGAGLVVGAVVTLGAAIATNFGGIQDTIKTTITNILGDIKPFQDAFQTFMDTLFPKDPEPPKLPTFNVNPTDLIQINPQGQSISLWSFFEGEGFIDKFSWTEFQKMAKDAGWDGKAIKPGDILNLIVPDGTGGSEITDSWMKLLPKPPSMEEAWRTFDQQNMEANKSSDDNIFTRLADAATAAWPKLQVALDGLWVNVSDWFTKTAVPEMNRLGGELLNSLAGVFGANSSTGQTKVYNAMTGLFDDVPQAAGQVSSDFQKNFPSISAGLTNLFKNMGTWIENEGVPTVARSLGFFVGKIAGLIGQGLGAIWSIITTGVSGLTGGQGAKGAGKAGEKFGDMVAEPFSSGIQDAIAQNGTSNPADVFLTNLGAALLTAVAVWKLAPGWATGVISAIGSPIVSAAGKGLSFVGNAITGAISTAVTNSMAGGILGEIWLKAAITGESVKAALGSAFTTAMAGLSAATSWIASTATSIWAALAPAIAAAATLAPFALAGLAIAATVGAVVMIFDENARAQVNAAVGNLIDGAFGEGSYDSLNKRFEEGAYKLIGGFYAAAALVEPDPSKKADLQAKAATLLEWATPTDQSIATWADANAQKIHDQQMMMFEKYGFDFTDIGQWFGGGYNGDPMNNQEFNVKSGGSFTQYSAGLTPKVADAINNTPMPTAEQLATFSTNLNATVNSAIANGQFDGQAITDQLIVPLANGFITNFGAEAPATMAWATFIESIKTGTTDIDTGFMLVDQDIVLLLADATKNMPLISAAITGALAPIIVSLNDANFIAKNLSATLASLDGATVTLTTQVIGGTAVDGSHAGGLDYVPYDGYIAELHKGERVLTADENGARGAVKSPTWNDGGNQYTFNITGVNDFDAFMREARRRGIPIGR